MIGDENKADVCRSCDAEFVIEGLNVNEAPTFCPFCGSVLEEDLDEEFFGDDEE